MEELCRSKFFAQYWGVKCLYVGGVGLVEVGNGRGNLKHPDFFLELKPISKLSDDDAIEYFDILWHDNHSHKSNDFKIEYGKDWANGLLSERFGLIPSNILHGIDFLRSKGYALPYLGYSIESLIENGFIKLK